MQRARPGKRLVALTICVAATAAAHAADFPAHYGRSPVAFDDIEVPSDTYVVNDRDSTTLDRYLFRSGSDAEIVIPIRLSRYVGDVDKLREKGLIGETFRIYIPAYDVDANTSPVFDCDGDWIPETFQPEVNEVYFNGELIGTLTGDNNLWTFNDSFELDISKLNFPSSPGGVGENTIEIRIDVANKDVPLSGGGIGCQVWATEIDWAAIRFETTSPVVFVPGLSGNADSLANSGYPQTLLSETGLDGEVIEHSASVPSIHACSAAAPSLYEHADQMRKSIKQMAERYGTDSVHLIAHSKGGLDSRAFLKMIADNPLKVRVGTMSGQPVYSDLTVPSLATHGSPHAGTAIADYVVASAPTVPLIASDLCDLTTHTMSQVNSSLRTPSGVTTLLLGGDADWDGSGNLSDLEAAGNQLGNPIANRFYRRLRDFAEFHVEWIMSPLAGPIATPVGTPTVSPQQNDTMVTVASALAAPGATATRSFVGAQGKNHGTVVDRDTQLTTIDAGVNGALNWRKR